MRAYVLYYDDFAEFEVIIAIGNVATLGERKGSVTAVAVENRPYVSEEKQKFLPDMTIDRVNPNNVDVFIIPGGKVETVIDNPYLKRLLQELDRRNKLIAAICGGPFILGKAGLLDNRSFTFGANGFPIDQFSYDKYCKKGKYLEQDLVIDGNIITAQAQAFIEFGTEVADRLGLYEDEDEMEKDYRWIKNMKMK